MYRFRAALMAGISSASSILAGEAHGKLAPVWIAGAAATGVLAAYTALDDADHFKKILELSEYLAAWLHE
jgi:hypothetical protein